MRETEKKLIMTESELREYLEGNLSFGPDKITIREEKIAKVYIATGRYIVPSLNIALRFEDGALVLYGSGDKLLASHIIFLLRFFNKEEGVWGLVENLQGTFVRAVFLGDKCIALGAADKDEFFIVAMVDDYMNGYYVPEARNYIFASAEYFNVETGAGWWARTPKKNKEGDEGE